MDQFENWLRGQGVTHITLCCCLSEAETSAETLRRLRFWFRRGYVPTAGQWGSAPASFSMEMEKVLV
jgi:hypothetical protein